MVLLGTPTSVLTVSVDLDSWGPTDRWRKSCLKLRSLKGEEENQEMEAQAFDSNEKKRKKMRRQARRCGGKNKEEIETQRMSHIAVERNRRRLMNDHLCVIRSIMPKSYIQKGDQASIVGGAINYVRKLEHLLLTLEVKKMSVVKEKKSSDTREEANGSSFLNPRFSSCLSQNNVDVTLIDSHANIRILVPKKRGQLMRIVAGFQALGLTVQHLNVTALEDPMVLYSFSAKLEEGCSLTSADDIEGAVHHVLSLING